MSKISDAVAAVRSKIETAFPDRVRLNFPYNLQDCPDYQLKFGYGIQLDGGENGDVELSCADYVLTRTVTVILTQFNVAQESDPDRRETKELQLFEDLHTLISTFVSDPTMSGVVIAMVYKDDTGRQEVYAGEQPYAYLEVSFDMKYQQQVS